MVNLTCDVLYEIIVFHYPLMYQWTLQLELLCMHVLMDFDRNGLAEPGWHQKRAESFPNSHGFETCMQSFWDVCLNVKGNVSSLLALEKRSQHVNEGKRDVL